MSDNIIRKHVPNRTENWRTARTFAPYICPDGKPEASSLANSIVSNAKNREFTFPHNEVHLELFWKGFRDYCKEEGIPQNNDEFQVEAIAIYQRLFPDLRKNIESYRGQLLNLKPENYVVTNTGESKKRFFANLFNTEIDVVISMPGFLLIGEAKDEQAFGANSKHIMTHQLVRQYVMATILCELIEEKCGQKTEVIPFVIGDNAEKYAQVKLLQHMNWLSPGNIISWQKLWKF